MFLNFLPPPMPQPLNESPASSLDRCPLKQSHSGVRPAFLLKKKSQNQALAYLKIFSCFPLPDLLPNSLIWLRGPCILKTFVNYPSRPPSDQPWFALNAGCPEPAQIPIRGSLTSWFPTLGPSPGVSLFLHLLLQILKLSQHLRHSTS